MSSIHLTFTVVESGLRWTAKLLAAVLVGLVLVIFVGVTLDGGFNPLKLRGVEPIQMVFFWIACIGMVVAWRWPFVGGAIATAGILLFYAVDVVVRSRFLNNLYFDLMLLAGILFLLSAITRKRMS